MTAEERDALVMAHIDLADAVVRDVMARYGVPECEREDMRGAAAVGLVDAASRFDPSRGVPFSNFAHRRVSGQILDHMASLRGAGVTAEEAREALDEYTRDTFTVADRSSSLEDYAHAKEALRRLPQQQRDLLRSLYAEDRQLTEIAKEQGLSKGWLSRLHARALDALREEGEQEQEEEMGY